MEDVYISISKPIDVRISPIILATKSSLRVTKLKNFRSDLTNMAKLILKLTSVRRARGAKLAVKPVHLADVPIDCQVYLFYFPGHEKYEDLKKALYSWGEISGKNLFVGLWGMDDPNYRMLARTFDLGDLPAIVITGMPTLGSIKERGEDVTAYVRVDSEELLSNKDKTMDSMERLYNYFIRGMVKQALRDAKKDRWRRKIAYYLGKLMDWLGKKINNFLKEHNIKIDIFKGIFEISPVKEET